jgi:Tfp pilus assembly protein PilF
MQVRKEQVFFVISLGVLGLMLHGDLGDQPVRSGSGTKTEKTLERHAVPDVAIALPDDHPRGVFHRDLFSPPKDTLPLPPLELELPVFEPLVALAPPSAWGPSMREAHRLLRRERVIHPVPELFQAEEEVAVVESDAPVSTATADDSTNRAELVEGYKQLYDWIRIPVLFFGHIRNADRFGLAARTTEPIEWVEVDPRSGTPRYGGRVAPIERSRVTEFGFADTPANRLELGRRALGDSLRPGQLESALEFAEQCLALRNEVPHALVLAEEVYTLADKVADGDPRPQLGLARCLELGFRFEEAFHLYTSLAETVTAQEVVLVHARFGDLLARFRMFDRAEEHYSQALKRANQNWEVRLRYGRFLLERGRTDEALANLLVAHDHEPQFPEAKLDRSIVRTNLGSAELQAGKLADAMSSFERALANDPEDSRALAGLFAASLYSGTVLPAARERTLTDALEHGMPGADFELLLALGLVAIERQQWAVALDNLERAADADPFRAGLAWRARSWLAEITGHPDEALRSIQLAYESDPTDAWTLYQRGRLLFAADDARGARESLEAALEREADFVDVLVLLGEIAQLDGRHDEAELYYERALAIDPAQPRVHARRGFNALVQGKLDTARASFGQAHDVASAGLGLAWCAYAEGEPVEATTELSEIADRLRNVQGDDPWRTWAETQIQRILDHESKEVWLDRFDRRSGEPANGWQIQIGTGLEVGLVDGRILIEGVIGTGGRTRILHAIPAGDFVNWQGEVVVESGTAARVGVFLALEKANSGPTESTERAAAMLSRNKDGAVQSRIVQSGNSEAPHTDVPGASWPTDRPVAVRIERTGEGNESNITIYLDGVPVVQDARVAALSSKTAELRFGVFVEGDPGRKARVSLDNVEVVRRKSH